uniref:Patatin-like phospholipase n=1 Tax=Pithovirus LCPAC302 TaxID=2506593 RepID=A0A481Z6D0_9VIRU|nr:MAG: patatin-like phospholipase [Pithovirus LCPAC302]
MESDDSVNLSISEMWFPDVVVLGPGGAKGYLELGALLKFEQENYFKNVTEWTGCSIGAAIALLIVIGYSITDIINDCINVNIINDITDINLEGISERPGILNNKTVENMLKDRLRRKCGIVPTLKQLYMTTGILFTTVSFNLDKMRSEYQSKDTEPNLSSVEAVMMSMAIPILIRPRRYRGHIYIDGAIGDPYPILIHDNGEKNILGIYIDSEHSSHSSDRKALRYLYRCGQASMQILRENNIKFSSEKCRHLSLNTPVVDSTGLTLTGESKKNMIDSGYRSASLFLFRIKYPERAKILLDENEEIPVESEDIENIGVLNRETADILDMISNDSQLAFDDDGSDEDLYVSDIDGDTLIIPITPEFRRNIERVKFR